MEYVVQQLLNTLSIGGNYALLALGLAIVFSVIGLVNFAYGEVIAVAGYVMFAVFAIGGIDYALVLMPIGVLAAVVISVTLERVAFRPVRYAPAATGLLTAFGVSIFLQNLFQLLISPRPQAFSLFNGMSATWYLGPYAVSSLQVMEFVIAAIAMAALVLFLNRSTLGIAMRAASRDFSTVRLMGIRANRVIATAFAISGALAGIACVFILARRGGVAPDMGFSLVLKAFVACVIGGFGSLVGAAAGGILLGFIEVGLLAALPQEMGGLKEALTYVIVTLILLYKPEGLFGARRELGDKEF